MVMLHAPRSYAQLIFALCLAVLSPAAWSAVDVSVDKNPVLSGEVLQMEIRVSGSNDADPDLSALEQDFRILQRSTSNQFQMINGRTSRSTSWHLQLLPKRLGRIDIPPITVGPEQSRPITLEVVKPQQKAGEHPEVFVEFEASKSRAHVREQVVLTARLFVRGELVGGSLTEPQASGAVIESLGEQTERQELLGRHRYRVIERHYALFPEQSGRMVVNAPVFSGELADVQRRRPVFGFGTSSRSVYASGEPLTLEIDPQDASFQGLYWLPAQEVVLEDSLSPADGPWKVGEPITRTIRLRVKGQLHTLLPDLKLSDPSGVQSYSEAPEDQSLGGPDGIVAIRSLSQAIIPSEVGKLDLPELQLAWWDTQSDQKRIARLPARHIFIAPGAQAPQTAAAEPAVTDTATVKAQETSLAESPNKLNPLWVILAISGFAGWFGTLFAWWWTQRRNADSNSATTNEELNLKQARAACIKALKDETDPALIRNALWAWVKTSQPQYSTLQAWQADLPSAAAQSLAALDASLYSRQAAEWDPQSLLEYISQWHPPKPPTNSGQLAALYPE